MANVLATVLDTCPQCGGERLVQPTRTGRICKTCHNTKISKIPRKYKASRGCKHCGVVIENAHPGQKWCKVCCPTVKANGRLKLYDMSQPEFEAQKKKQGNLCAVCHINRPRMPTMIHETGKNRELLCAWCNHGLAYMEDEEWKAKSEIYLEKHSGESRYSMDSKAV